MSAALLLVDVQNDFFPGGALPTPEGDTIIEPANRLIAMFKRTLQPIVATRDWHPEDHCSFKPQGGPWPPHCIQNTPGAEFHPRILLPENTIVVSAADTPDEEAYSGFKGTDLEEQLRNMNVSLLVVGGLATEVCVKHSVLDARERGFRVKVVREAISGIEAEPGDSETAIEEMKETGAEILSIDDLTL